MLIIWQGWGLMAILIPLIFCVFPALILAPYISQEEVSLIYIIGSFIGGIIVYILGKKLHDPSTNDIILYDEQGQGYRFKKHIDTLFWIPMEYCGIITSIGAFIIFICWIVNQT